VVQSESEEEHLRIVEPGGKHGAPIIARGHLAKPDLGAA
jgi:hypothetical protein